jgi:hypothetical protein
MIAYRDTPRLLGAAFLIVIVTTLIASIPFDSVTGNSLEADVESDGIPGMLEKIAGNTAMMHVGVLGGLLNSAAIVVLAVLCYVVLKEQDRVLALAALAMWLAEAIFFALTQIASLALITLSRDFIGAGTPADPFYRVMGEFLYNDLYSQGFVILMWFYCIGGLFWYYLFYKSGYVSRAISLFGILAVTLGLALMVPNLFGYEIFNLGFLLVLPFESASGAWLRFKGIKEYKPPQDRPAEGRRYRNIG